MNQCSYDGNLHYAADFSALAIADIIIKSNHQFEYDIKKPR